MENESVLKIKDEITLKANEFARLTKQAQDIKVRIDDLKAFFEKLAEEKLKDTKTKSITFWGDNSKVFVSNSESVKPISVQILKSIFGETFADFFKEKQSTELTDPCKKLLCSIFLGNFIEVTLLEVISQISPEEKIRAILRKKLKGNSEKDKVALISVAGLSEESAEYYAYMTAEAIAYDRFSQVLKASKWSGSVDEAVMVVKSAVIVEEGIKVSLETDEK
jgi:hypothetical protein